MSKMKKIVLAVFFELCMIGALVGVIYDEEYFALACAFFGMIGSGIAFLLSDSFPNY